MARIIGYICFNEDKMDPDFLEKASGSFNLGDTYTNYTFLRDDSGFPFVGLAQVENGIDAYALEKGIVQNDTHLFLFDGRFDGYGNEDYSYLPQDKICEKLVSNWMKYPVYFISSQHGGGMGLKVDIKRKTLTLFRDRFGSRTLYYYHEDGIFLFSSEIKGLLEYSGLEKSLNMNMFGRFMSMNYRMWFGRDDTFFNNIFEFPLASYTTVTSTGFNTQRYWAPPDAVFSDLVDDEIYISGFKKNLYDSVESALNQSENQLFLVSGGLDAPVIASIAHDIQGKKIDCCGAVFPEFPAYDESVYIKALTDKIGKRTHLYQLDQEAFLETYCFLLSRHDQPLLSPTYVLTYRLLEYAQGNGYKSVFGGGGGDIASQGCLEYQPYLLADYYHTSNRVFEEQISAWCEIVGPYLRYWPGKSQAMIDLIAKIVDLDKSGKIRNNPDWIRKDLRPFGNAMADIEFKDPDIGVQYGTYRQSRIAEELFHQAIATHFVEEINSASFDLALYDPFWSLDLIEFCFQMPVKMFLRNGWTKHITRMATSGILPDELRLRPDKTGLGIPVAEWFKTGPLRETLDAVLNSSFFLESNLFNPDYIYTAVHNHMSGREPDGNLLWKLFSFCMWAERWL